MRNQYAGDISDLLKFALLRTLAGDNKTIGVGWYYNPVNDGRSDGRHREYCNEDKWKSLDSTVWDALRKLSERSLKALEKLPIWPPNTRFHRVPIQSNTDRHSWALGMQTALLGSDIVFLDPDNGVGGVSKQHATFDEVKVMRQEGKSVVVIKFPARTIHDRQLEAYHDMLRDRTSAASLVTVQTCVWLGQPRSRWFTIVDADGCSVERAKEFAQKLAAIEKCSAEVVCGPWRNERRKDQTMMGKPSIKAQLPPQSPASDRTRTVENVCPECRHQFKGNGFDGIDAHWRSKHEAVMPYKDAWPLVKSGNYHH
jgi:hypothetical protein